MWEDNLCFNIIAHSICNAAWVAKLKIVDKSDEQKVSTVAVYVTVDTTSELVLDWV